MTTITTTPIMTPPATNGSTPHVPANESAPSPIDTLLAAIAKGNAKTLPVWAVNQAPLLAALTTAEMVQVKLALRGAGVTKRFIEGDLADVIDEAREDAAPSRAPSDGVNWDPYQVVEGQICARTRVGSGDDVTFDYLPLCNFNAAITADIEMDDGEEVTRHVALAGQLASGRHLPEIVIPAKDFDGLGWVADRWGARPILETGRSTRDRLRHAISTLSAETTVDRRIFTHTGWRVIEGERVFLHGTGGLGADGISVEMPGRLKEYVFPTDSAIDARSAMIECLKLLDIAPLSVTGPIWASMFLAPLTEIIDAPFVLWIEGPSGSKKSTVASLMLNMYGPTFHEKHMPADWISTANSLEMLAFHAKDVPLVIDDFRPSESRQDAKEQNDKAARIMRAVGNRQGRGRMTKTQGAARTYIPRGVVIATAELGAAGKSVRARQLTVTVKKGAVNLGLLTIAQTKRHVYGYAMSEFIRWAGVNWAVLGDSLRSAMLERRESGSKTQHSRLPDAINSLYCAFDTAMTWAVSIGALSYAEAEAYCTQFDEALCEMAQEQQSNIDAEDPANKFVSALIAMLHGREVLITSKMRPSLGGGERRIGWWNGTEISLIPDAAFAAVVPYLSRSGVHFPATKNDLGRDLMDAGWLTATERETLQVKRADPAEKGPGKDKLRVYAMNATKLFDLAATMGLAVEDLAERNTPADPENR